MPDGPLVSFCVNNCNYGRFLPPLLDALLAQTYPNVEIIVVDDGSTDESREVLERYADRVTVELQERSGQAAACNRSYELSHGEIVVFHDSDDLFHPDGAARLVEVFADPSVVMSFTRLGEVDQDGRATEGIHPPAACPMWGGDLRALVLDRVVFFWPETTGQAYRRSFLDTVMPLPAPMAPDFFLSHHGALAGKVAVIEQPIASYRVHGRNKSLVPPMHGLEWIQDKLGKRVALHRALSSYAAANHIIEADPWPARDYLLEALRLANQVVLRSRGRLSTARRGVRAVLGHPQLGWKSQVRHMGWFVATAVAPTSLGCGLVGVEFPLGKPYQRAS